MKILLYTAPRTLRCALVLISAFSFQLSAFAQTTAFTYQGRLNDGANPANGSYDLTFALFDAASGGAQQGSALTNSPTAVSNGLFTVTLDFGNQFPGADRWLEIGVVTNGGGAFNTLAPRQPLTSTPYAVRAVAATSADTAGTATTAVTATVASSVAASNISGTITTAQLPATVITNGASGVNFTGTFSGNGAGLAGLDVANLNINGAIAWVSNFSVAAASTVAAGASPLRLSIGDLNGDSRPDLVVVNPNPGSMTLLTNNGSGGFAFAGSVTSGFSLVAATIIDMNADGRPDLVSGSLSGTVTIHTNNGVGGFITASTSAFPNISAFRAADMNSDNRLDLVCVDSGNNQVKVLTNNGTGNFALAALANTGASPNDLGIGDVNNDGKADVVTANAGNNTLTILTNNGTGGFALTATAAVGSFPRTVVVTDLNGDGQADLACPNSGGFGNGNTISILTNNGSGGFALATTAITGSGPYSLACADMNGDGRPDLISANFGSGSGGNALTILTNAGQGGFAIAASPVVGSGPYHVQAADLNGDARADLVSVNYLANTLSILLQQVTGTVNFSGNGGGLTNLNSAALAGTVSFAHLPATLVTNGASGLTLNGSFAGSGAGLANVNLSTANSYGALRYSTNVSFVFGSSTGVGASPFALAEADVNNDGRMDVINTTHNASALVVSTNNGNGGFTLAYNIPLSSTAFGVSTADMNGDGRTDIIAVHFGFGFGNQLSLLINNGIGGFDAPVSLTAGVGPVTVTPADVNGDGRLDLVSANYGDSGNGNSLTVLTNNGSGGFAQSATLTVGGGPASVVATDVNNDGKTDLVSANYSASTLSVLTNSGSSFSVAATLPTGAGPWSLMAVDLNGDGKPDLASANTISDVLTVLTNTGNGGFAVASSPPVPAGAYRLAAADFNLDGRVDLAVSSFDPSTLVSVLPNQGNGSFGVAVTFSMGSMPASILARDVNGDAKPDLISANFNESSLTVLWNTSTTTAAFLGDGSGLTSLSASNLIGTVADAHLSSNVVLRVGDNSFTGNQIITGSVTATEFSGSGSSLTALNASSLASGTVFDGRLSENVALRIGGNSFSGLQQFTQLGVSGSPSVDQSLTAYTGGFTGSTDHWQSFTAGTNGFLTSVALRVGSPLNTNSSPGTIRIYAGEGTGGVLLATESVTWQPTTIPPPFQTNTFSAPPYLMAGRQYTIRFGSPTASSAWVPILSDPYPGGQFSGSSIWDCGFITLMTPAVAGETFLTAGTVQNPGYVGIGTNSPQARLHVAGNVLVHGDVNFAGTLTGDGAALTGLTATNLTGTVPLARLPGAVLTNNATGVSLVGDFSGTGSGLTALNATSITTGTLADARLSANVVLLNANQTFSGSNTFAGVARLTNDNNTVAGNGSGLTALNASSLATGTVSDGRLSANVALLNANNQFTGINGLNDVDLRLRGNADALHALGWYGTGKPFAGYSPDGPMLFGFSAGGLGTTINTQRVVLFWNSAGRVGIGTGNPTATLDVAGSVSATNFTGNGSGLTNLPAANLTGAVPAASLTSVPAASLTGTIADARLSANVALLNAHQSFGGSNTFSGVVTATNANNKFAGVFDGPYVKFSDHKPKGTGGGGSVANGINLRTFNTIVNSQSLGSFNNATNLVLPAGTYQCRISAPAYRVSNHQARLRIAGGGSVLIYGTPEFSTDGAGGDRTASLITGQFTLPGPGNSTVVVEHFTQGDTASNGLGTAANASWTEGDAVEVYTVAEFWKVR